MPPRAPDGALASFHPAVRAWFAREFAEPTPPQARGWPAIAKGDSVLLLSPTGSGKTLAAFLWCIDRLMFEAVPGRRERCRVLYVSPMKALAVDVERNLRAPIAGVTAVAVERGDLHHVPAVAVRTGDTPSAERARFQREPADILITTPESLYLLLTSNAREALRAVDTVIVDEIHALVPTKRGAHLALSLERLERLCRRPLQRIGLSATQRPLDEVARFLGGSTRGGDPRSPGSTCGGALRSLTTGTTGTASTADTAADAAPADAATTIHDEFSGDEGEASSWRPVTIVDAGARKRLDLRVEVPIEDMARAGQEGRVPSGATSQGPPKSIWTAIHPRLLELVLAHRATLLFVNSRRIAERLAGALNELAGEYLVRAHHGSIAREQRAEVEEALKAGTLRGLVATSSLELGIDMGAIDLVIQIEAPPSVASGMQRVGRASHQVDAVSRGIVFPKFRGDLVACAAATQAMHEGRVEATRFPRNPLDVLAQQIVAMTAMDTWPVETLLDTVRQAAPFTTLSRTIFDGVLDMLSGRYPSDEFADLRPRLTWDRRAGTVTARESAKRVAVVSGGTIPDRGLYGVFLAGGEKGAARVGELDEEMVHETRVGETFVLGATTWRVEEISHDRVLVSPAPGEPGKMPFWKADTAGRPLEFGQAIGALVRTLSELPPSAAITRLTTTHDMDPAASENLLRYLHDQRAVTRALPDDRTIVVERCRDELGDWRICLLSPLGGQVLAPWAMAAAAVIRERRGIDVETMWTDEGFVVRMPETDAPPDVSLLVPGPDEVEALVVSQLGSTALFAAKFRECAARALLLPRRRPGQRTPLWQQRKRAYDLLQVASRYGSFPMLLESYRECLRDQFDMPALTRVLRDIARREVSVVTVDTDSPSPFAASLLFGYVANYIYDGDAPLAERRAQALTIDQKQLRELLGEAELREVLDADVIDQLEHELQRLDGRGARSADSLHDLLLRLGDLSEPELAARSLDGSGVAWADTLTSAQRAIWVPVAGERRLIAVEDAARYRDALGVPLSPDLPEALLVASAEPLGTLVSRFARAHAPFPANDVSVRFGVTRQSAERALHRLVVAGRLIEGAFRPGGAGREWCDPGVLASLRQRSLAKLRRAVQPVEPHVLGRFVVTWHGVIRPRRGLDALLDAVERLQGMPAPASVLESEILPARVEAYASADLDTLIAAGEVTWTGVEPLGDRDGRVALYLTDHLQTLRRPTPDSAMLDGREHAIVDVLGRIGAMFFAELHDAAGGGYPGETVDALWNLVWRGLVTNDSLHALRAVVRPPASKRRTPTAGRAFRTRRTTPPAGQGRWSLVPSSDTATSSATQWSAAVAQQLLARHGIVTRETAAAESVPGGFSGIYQVYRSMEERGRLRRGYFAAGVGATQFALPAALDLLRALRETPEQAEVARLSAVDPANPYGALLAWPETDQPLPAGARGPTRTTGASVILVNGRLGAWIGRGGRPLLTFLPQDEPERSTTGRAVAACLAAAGRDPERPDAGMLVTEVNLEPAPGHPLAAWLVEAGFVAVAGGFLVPRESHDRADGAATGDGAATARARRPSRTLASSPFSALKGTP